ncbi:MAG: hypothetical protein HXX17_10625 [Geobacteraceae bacterium]|nr:hypothetical protein [Geobacteraceae bacterium]
MSQEAVERVLGRMITDEKFRHIAADSLETVCFQEGYLLSRVELSMISGLNLRGISEFAAQLHPDLRRAR